MFTPPDKTLIRYLLDNYIQLVLVENKQEYKRLRDSPSDDMNSNRQKRYDLELFEKKMAEKILQEYAYDVIVNKCPNCQQLARTPFARQCPHCFHSWHGNSASFKINHTMRLTGRGFYIIGKHVSGAIKAGMKIAFDQIGIAKTGAIMSFEFVRGPRGLKNIEEIGLEIEGLTEQEEKEISLNCPYLIPVPVVK